MPAEQPVPASSEHASVRRSGHLVYRRSQRRKGINTQREHVYTYTPAWLALPLLFSFSPLPPVSSSAPSRLSWWERDGGWTVNELLQPAGNYSSWSMTHRKGRENTHRWIHNCHKEKRGLHLVFLLQASPFNSSWNWIVRCEHCWWASLPNVSIFISKALCIYKHLTNSKLNLQHLSLCFVDRGFGYWYSICILAKSSTLKIGRFSWNKHEGDGGVQ